MLDLVRATLADAGLEGVADRILGLARPAVRLSRERARDQRLVPGASKIGGFPDLPPGAEWPTWADRRLPLLAQINLTDLHPFGFCDVLPREGLLQFFYDDEHGTWGFDPKDRGSWCVRFEPSVQGLVRTPSDKHFPSCRLTSSAVTTLADWNSHDFQQLGLSRQELLTYFGVLDDLEAREPEPGPLHQILGNPAAIQGDMQLESQLVSNGLYCGNASGYQDPRAKELEPGAADWRLLFQLDSDDEAEMMWGDGGRLYFWITNESLESREFDKSWMVLQCT
jgi:uncharacterized protein YwqG